MDTAEWEKHTIAATCLEWSGSRAKDADACPPPPWCLADLTAMPAVCLINLSLLLCSQAGDVEKILLCLLCLCAHTQSFLSHMHKAHSRVPLKGTDSEQAAERRTHTSHFKAQHWKNTSKNKNNLSRKTTMVHFPLRKKLITSQALWSSAHWVFAAKKKETESLLCEQITPTTWSEEELKQQLITYSQCYELIRNVLQFRNSADE